MLEAAERRGGRGEISRPGARDAFVDRRNPDAVENFTHGDTDESAEVELAGSNPPDLQLEWPPPRLVVHYEAPTVDQRYHVEIWCEKTTMNDVLMPLGDELRVTIVTGLGELSITACHAVIERAIASGKPVRILYVSDFDPAA